MPLDFSLESLIEQTAGQIRSYIAGFGLNRDDIDDVAQEVYLAWHQDGSRKPAEVEHIRWLKGIARHRALDRLRRERAGPQRVALAELISAAPAPDLINGEELRDCLERLTTADRALLDRHYVDGLDSIQMGAESGRSGSAVRRDLARLRDALHRCIQRHLVGQV